MIIDILQITKHVILEFRQCMIEGLVIFDSLMGKCRKLKRLKYALHVGKNFEEILLSELEGHETGLPMDLHTQFKCK